MTAAQVTALKIDDNDSNTLYNGAIIWGIMSEFSDRYMLIDSVLGYMLVWHDYCTYKLPEFLKAYQAVNSNYDPVANYDMHEQYAETVEHGDITHTHAPDSTHNTTTTEQTKSEFSEYFAGDNGSNLPKTSHYVRPFDGSLREESYDERTGKDTTHAYTEQGKPTTTTVTDDRKYTDTESHSTVTATTYSGDTVTADDITQHELTRKGNIGTLTTQQMIDSSLDLARKSLIRNFVQDFMCIYTFYAGGGDYYDTISL